MSQVAKSNLDPSPCTFNGTARVTFYMPLERVDPPEPIRTDRLIPNSATAKVITDMMAGKDVVECENVDDMFHKLRI